jgi:hypothetical protein
MLFSFFRFHAAMHVGGGRGIGPSCEVACLTRHAVRLWEKTSIGNAPARFARIGRDDHGEWRSMVYAIHTSGTDMYWRYA